MVIRNEDLDEELMAHQAELEEQQQLARRQQEEAERAERERQRRREILKQVTKPIKKAVKRRAMALGARLLAVIAPYVLPVLGIFLAIVVLIAVVLITASALCNAGGYTGLLTNLTSASVGITGGPDFCKQLSGLQGAVSSIDQAGSSFCSTPQFMAQQNNVPYPATNDPDLGRLVSCITARVSSVGEISSFDKSNTLCNYTRGQRTCTPTCSHTVNSCHYGGSAGRTGSYAVDFGGSPGTGNEGVIGPQILQAAAACSAELNIPLKRSTCEAATAVTPGGDNAVPCADPRATHAHITIAKCEQDNGPLNTQ